MWATAAAFLGGKGGMAVVWIALGAAAGAFLMDLRNDAAAAGEWEKVAREGIATFEANSKRLGQLVKQQGNREMNYAWQAEAQRQQCALTVETFRRWDTLGVEEKKAARAQADRLAADLKTISGNYEELVKGLEGGDATLTQWLNTDLPADLKCMRYGAKGCSADPYARAGYPAPPGRPPAVAEPPK